MALNPPPYYPYPNPFNPPFSPSGSPPPPPPVSSPRAAIWENFRRRVSLVESPPVGASFIAISLFLLIAFLSNNFTQYTSLARLGISISLTVVGLIVIIILILFLL